MKNKKKRSINLKLSLTAAFFMVVIILVTQILAAVILSRTIAEDSEITLTKLSEDNANIMENWLDGQGAVLETMMASLSYMDELDHNKIMDFLAEELKKNDAALMYYLCFEYDKSVNPADHSELDLDPTGRTWWIAAMEKNGLIYTDPYVDFATGQMIVSVAAPLKIKGEQAVILADITIDQLVDQVNSIGNNGDTKAFLLAADGSVITHPNKEYMPNEKGNTILDNEIDINVDSESVSTIKDYDGNEKSVAISTIDSTGWKIGITQDKSTISDQIAEKLSVMIITSIILLAVAIVLLVLQINSVIKPLKKSMDVIIKLSNGDLSAKIEKSNESDEMADLQNAVSTLSDNFSGIIGDANTVLGKMADYDLTGEKMQDYPGDFNELSNSVNSIEQILAELLKRMKNSADAVETGSSQLAMAASNLSEISMEQASSIITLEDDVNTMTSGIRRSSEQCKLINESLCDLDNRIVKGSEEMAKLMEAVKEIESMSNDIQKVVGVIDSIAFQTNILALNASVEAARASENGKGFAVVAEEVRTLAEKSSSEAKRTAELIDGCIAGIVKAKKCADETNRSLEIVVENSAQINKAFEQISDDNDKQAKSAKEIEAELNHVSSSVTSNTATAEETAAASQSLLEEAGQLKSMTEKFKI